MRLKQVVSYCQFFMFSAKDNQMGHLRFLQSCFFQFCSFTARNFDIRGEFFSKKKLQILLIIFVVYGNFKGQDEKFMSRLLCQLSVITENRPHNFFSHPS